MNVLHIAVFKTKNENPDLIKLLLHYGVDDQACCSLKIKVRSYIVY